MYISFWLNIDFIIICLLQTYKYYFLYSLIILYFAGNFNFQ
jgi:hypothetical protein